jgi:hypothetical protein
MIHHWLLVALKKSDYSTDDYLRKHGLKYRPTRHIVDYLKDAGLVTSKKGAKYGSNPMKTRLYPTPSFARQLLNFYLDTLEAFDGDYLQFEPDAKRDPVDDNNWAKAVANWLDDKKVKDTDKAPVIAAIERFGSVRTVINAIVERNRPIEACLMQGKAMW